MQKLTQKQGVEMTSDRKADAATIEAKNTMKRIFQEVV
jgi:hypothetical protein